jgi:hypothetical protein
MNISSRFCRTIKLDAPKVLMQGEGHGHPKTEFGKIVIMNYPAASGRVVHYEDLSPSRIMFKGVHYFPCNILEFA